MSAVSAVKAAFKRADDVKAGREGLNIVVHEDRVASLSDAEAIDHDVPAPVEEPSEPVPTPSERDDPTPMDVLQAAIWGRSTCRRVGREG